MKKICLISCTLLMALSLWGCGQTYEGSRIGNDSELVMDYKVLNTTDYQWLALNEGDTVDFDIVNDSGNLDVVLQKDKSEPVYEGINVPTSSFQVNIEESGSYKCSVTGQHARGSVSIVKEKED